MNGTVPLDPTTTPPHASLAQAHERQLAVQRLFRVLCLLGLGLVVIFEVRGTPTPGLSGDGLPVLVALIGFALGMMGTVLAIEAAPMVLTALVALLAVSSGALFWLQPDSPGILGCFIAVTVASLRLPRRYGALVGATALVAIAAPALFSSGHSLSGMLLNGVGVVAFFAMGELAHRLREGQDLASRLLVELEESQQARTEAAALAERQRVAREMHDVLAHSLSGLVLQLEGARLLAKRTGADEELGLAIERALHLGKSGLSEARRAIGMLRDDELPGPEALTALVGDFERDARVPCSVEISGAERPLTSVVRLTLYRVAQEALTNARRHARPDRVELRLVYEPDGTRLTVEDFEPASAAPHVQGISADRGGYGISGMRERAELLGGRLEACPTGHGFRVELWVPA